MPGRHDRAIHDLLCFGLCSTLAAGGSAGCRRGTEQPEAVSVSGRAPAGEPEPPPSSPQSRPAEATGRPGPAASAAQASGGSLRSAEDRARDVDRKPQAIMDFFGVEPGQTVAELMAGRGYYAELLAERVGPTGRVYAHNSPFVLRRFAEKPLSERLKKSTLSRVDRINRDLDEPALPEGLDAVLMILFYHDTYWQGVDRRRMNRAVYRALRPGGVYGIVDHHAEPGTGTRDVKTLHRVDAGLVRKEIEAAGFVLEATTDILRNPEDDHTVNVFDPEIRGQTDRFVYRFRKPPA